MADIRGRAAFAAALTLALTAAVDAAAADADRGGELFRSRCGVCHSLDANRVGPALRGVFGRKAGKAQGFSYSPAVRSADLVWNDRTLEIWLSNPQAFVPGQRMNFRIPVEADRADIIAFLRRESAAQ